MIEINDFTTLKSENLEEYKRGFTNDIVDRVFVLADYIKKTHETIRKTASVFGLSKSSVHNDLSYRLPKIDSELSQEIRVILDENFAEKHIRGGEATRRKYAEMAY